MDDTHIGAVALAVVLAAVYLALVRALDPNEREPLWAIVVLYMSGLLVAAVAYLCVPISVLELSTTGESITKTAVIAVAVALGLGLVTATGRDRGWSEVNGALDGVVYGASAGFGAATAYSVANDLVLGSTAAGLTAAVSGGWWNELWPVALVNLADGVFGAIFGAACGAAVARRGGARAGIIAGGLVVTFLLRLLHDVLSHPSPTSDYVALRNALGLALPVLVIVAVVVFSLRRERSAITTQLREEVDHGVVTPQELSLLSNYGARRTATMRRLLSGDLDGWMDLKALHGRQVQLAMAKQRYLAAESEEERAPVLMEIQSLRAAVQWIRAENPSLSAEPVAAGGVR